MFELKDYYSKWYMVLLAKFFGTKIISKDETSHGCYTTTAYRFMGKTYVTDVKTPRNKGN